MTPFRQLNDWLKRLLDGPGLKAAPAPPTIGQQYADTVARMVEENKRQGNPFNVPEGWHKVVAGGGESFGFFCPVCKLQMLTAGLTVKHCRRTETRPTGRLALRRLKKFTPQAGQIANWKVFS
jgi:hypothetical protein